MKTDGGQKQTRLVLHPAPPLASDCVESGNTTTWHLRQLRQLSRGDALTPGINCLPEIPAEECKTVLDHLASENQRENTLTLQGLDLLC